MNLHERAPLWTIYTFAEISHSLSVHFCALARTIWERAGLTHKKHGKKLMPGHQSCSAKFLAWLMRERHPGKLSLPLSPLLWGLLFSYSFYTRRLSEQFSVMKLHFFFHIFILPRFSFFLFGPGAYGFIHAMQFFKNIKAPPFLLVICLAFYTINKIL